MYNNTTGHQQLKHRAKPMCDGNCHHGCLTGNVCVPRGTRPFVGCLRPEAPVRMRPGMPGIMVRSGAHTWNPTDSQSCAERTKWPAKGRRGLPWARRLGISFRTGSEHKYVWVLQLIVFIRNYNILKYNLNLIDKYIKMFSATSGSHWHNLKLNIFTYLNKYT